MPTLRRDAEVYVLDLGDDENTFTPDWMSAVTGLFEEVAIAPGPRALVTTGRGKFFSNGLDLDWLAGHGDRLGEYVGAVHELLAAVLTLPVPAVAAINGHAFGAGAMLALAHDFRVMRADRGYMCFPEVDIRIPFTPGMAALVQAKLTPAAAVVAMTTGQRFGGPAAVTAGLADEAVAADEVLSQAVDRAAALAGKDPGTLGAIKSTMYGSVAGALRAAAGAVL
jgi:enoyl-CoA hydratase/carnithine racemase